MCGANGEYAASSILAQNPNNLLPLINKPFEYMRNSLAGEGGEGKENGV